MLQSEEYISVSDFKEVFERIKLATNTKTQLEVAEVLGIRQSSISDAKRRNSVPSDWCMKLFVRFGLSPDWIMKGTGPMFLRTDEGYAPVDPELPLKAYEGAALYSDPNAKSDVVSVYSMLDWSSGGGKVSGKLSMPHSFVQPSVTVFQLDSTDMEPLIRKGAYIGVDTAQKKVVSGELYALGMSYGSVAVRRVFPGSQGEEATLRAENPQHPEAVLSHDVLGDAIIGRVVWTLNKY